MRLTTLLKLSAVAVVASVAIGCTIDSERSHRAWGGSSASPPGGGPVGDGAPSATPLLVDVDTDQTMTAAPGQGVGVFTEYATGGHWHIWWTCDTNLASRGATDPNLACSFDVNVAVASGVLAIAGVEGTDVTLDAQTTTTAQVHGIRFDTDPGAIITLDAAMGGIRDGRFLFFVQDGKVNGGYTGTLTDPLMLVGTTP
jgi:hypothetical protein